MHIAQAVLLVTRADVSPRKKCKRLVSSRTSKAAGCFHRRFLQQCMLQHMEARSRNTRPYSDRKTVFNGLVKRSHSALFSLNERPVMEMRNQVQKSGTPETNMLLTVAQVCAKLGIGRTKFYTLVDRGLPTVKLGGSRRVRYTSLERWIEHQEQLLG